MHRFFLSILLLLKQRIVFVSECEDRYRSRPRGVEEGESDPRREVVEIKR